MLAGSGRDCFLSLGLMCKVELRLARSDKLKSSAHCFGGLDRRCVPRQSSDCGAWKGARSM